MKTLEKNYDKIFQLLLLFISITLIFRVLNTIIAFIFILFNLIFIKKLKYNKKKIIMSLIIASPFILDLIFFWHNPTFNLALKATEKHLVLFFFPFMIIGYHKKINLRKLLINYSTFTFFVLVTLLVRYIIIYNENVLNYLNGKFLWKMGYHFSQSFGIHAPWLNMQVAFFSIISFYLFLTHKEPIRHKNTIRFLFIFLSSIFFIMIINTRVAVISSIIGYILVSIIEILNKTNRNKVVKRIPSLFLLFILSLTIFIIIFPYSIKKFTKGSFSNMDKIGKLDDFKNPEKEIYSGLVTRVSIWKSAIQLSKKSPWIGFGASNSKRELIKYYQDTNQKFLAKYEFPTHNQFIDYFLKFGILGLIVVFLYVFNMCYLGFKLRNPIIISFFVLFLLSNITDDFLIIYSGISFSGFWSSVFSNIK